MSSVQTIRPGPVMQIHPAAGLLCSVLLCCTAFVPEQKQSIAASDIAEFCKGETTRTP